MEETMETTSSSAHAELEALENVQPVESEDIDTLKAKNAQLYARAKKAEEKLKVQPIAQETLSTNPSYERLELKIDGYSDEEADFILRNGGKEALKSELVKSAIEAQRQKQKSLEATPEGNSTSPVLKQFTEEDLKALPLDEMIKHIPR